MEDVQSTVRPGSKGRGKNGGICLRRGNSIHASGKTRIGSRRKSKEGDRRSARSNREGNAGVRKNTLDKRDQGNQMIGCTRGMGETKKEDGYREFGQDDLPRNRPSYRYHCVRGTLENRLR